ncbi:MAG: hydroxymethylglutaryl-CoA lyase [Arenicellales bacterium]|nr:hydroxymethylglutaryl-CoA lyase [Arenicellales bacterium]MDP6550711.1 hydroxymethylglutaryl-CoA lyase [Arenicellales bacterium]MDP6792295.1 hydroxymethylglutaryl-CoA lyase [Arenicellales bacterium]MDP6920025.1 hydroxymethylglutaryl-CoA lyase [Arenicellales bacterium]
MPMRPEHIRIVEVGPRDGLQNEAEPLSPKERVQLIEQLANAGLKDIEAGAFVSPRWVPQMAGSDEVLASLSGREDLRLPVLVPNSKGYQDARAAGAREIAVFGSASETFSQRNINCSIDESLARFAEVCRLAKDDGVLIRGYISCVLGCPYEGEVDIARVAALAAALTEMGCSEISLGDTIGVGTPDKARALVKACASESGIDNLSVHFHDTYGQALANILACIEIGVTSVDAAVGGLGGCPYASGSAGNVATEDVVYLLQGLGIGCAASLDKLVTITDSLSHRLGHPPASRVARAQLAKRH